MKPQIYTREEIIFCAGLKAKFVPLLTSEAATWAILYSNYNATADNDYWYVMEIPGYDKVKGRRLMRLLL